MKHLKVYVLALAVFLLSTAFRSDKPAYRVFTAEGKKADFGDILKEAKKAEVVYFGELHNNPISHWLQLELARSLEAELGDKLVMGAEMFESDGQLLLDEYLEGTISTSNFEKQSRLWPNYKTDYKPLVEFAKEKGLDFIATNIPRRYASVVHKKGFEGLDSLSAEAKEYIAPLPVPYDPELPGYSAMMQMGGGMSGHGSSNLPKAQAIKDATMGHFIVQNIDGGEVMLHFNGSYHSQNREGILWYVEKYKPGTSQVTITTVEQEDVGELLEENEGLADFIVVVPETMTKTY